MSSNKHSPDLPKPTTEILSGIVGDIALVEALDAGDPQLAVLTLIQPNNRTRVAYLLANDLFMVLSWLWPNAYLSGFVGVELILEVREHRLVSIERGPLVDDPYQWRTGIIGRP